MNMNMFAEDQDQILACGREIFDASNICSAIRPLGNVLLLGSLRRDFNDTVKFLLAIHPVERDQTPGKSLLSLREKREKTKSRAR